MIIILLVIIGMIFGAVITFIDYEMTNNLLLGGILFALVGVGLLIGKNK